MDRRTFIFRSTGSLAIVSSPVFTPLTAAAFATQNAASKDDSGLTRQHLTRKLLTRKEWTTIAAVQNHLFPSDPAAPGAVEINTTSYLHDYLSNPTTDPVDTSFIRQGVIDLELLAKTETGKQFIDLSNQQRENLLRQYEQQREGRRWLTTILNYVLEALLTDPVYGGNTEGIGWKWLEHRAGQPRPPMNKRYWLL
jgi:gluconate 2-dehydrogenase gamma chain